MVVGSVQAVRMMVCSFVHFIPLHSFPMYQYIDFPFLYAFLSTNNLTGSKAGLIFHFMVTCLQICSSLSRQHEMKIMAFNAQLQNLGTMFYTPT